MEELSQIETESKSQSRECPSSRLKLSHESLITWPGGAAMIHLEMI